MLVSTLLIAVLFFRVYSNSINEAVSETSEGMMKALTGNMNFLLENLDSLSQLYISNPTIEKILRDGSLNRDWGKTNTVKSFITSTHVIFSNATAVYMFDEAGAKIAFAVGARPPLEWVEVRTQPWYADAVRAQGGHVLAVDTARGELLFVRKLYSLFTIKPIGTLVFVISRDTLRRSLGLAQQQSRTILWLELDGQTLFLDNAPASDALRRALFVAVPPAAERVLNLRWESQPYLYISQTINTSNAKINGLIPMKDLTKLPRWLPFLLVIIVFGNFLFLYLGALLAFRVLVRPLDALARAMMSTEDGVLQPVVIEHAYDEIDRLSHVYNRMAERIQSLIEDLRVEEQQKRQHELASLQAQIKPHFLYNVFDAISSLALAGSSGEVYTLMSAVGSFYRKCLSRGDEVVTLREEMEITRNYLTIQQFRYPEVFISSIAAEEDTLGVMVPKLILQPMVENAIYHGLKSAGKKGRIAITACRKTETVEVSVSDNGVGMDKQTVDKLLASAGGKGAGFGLSTTIERLGLFYDHRDIVTIDSHLNEGTTIVISIPLPWGTQG
jgi:two-component system sensor histidine kinase YesM